MHNQEDDNSTAQRHGHERIDHGGAVKIGAQRKRQHDGEERQRKRNPHGIRAIQHRLQIFTRTDPRLPLASQSERFGEPDPSAARVTATEVVHAERRCPNEHEGN